MNPETNFLARAIKYKRARLSANGILPLETVRARALRVRRDSQPHSFRRALDRDGELNVIAEIKRASPSKGIIKENFEPSAMARAYTLGGAAALSVLTEEKYFLGSLDDLRAAREVSQLPILRKDFIIDEYQIYEAASAGADAILLIVAALGDEQLSQFRRVTEEELGMDALVEVHTSAEMERAVRCGATLLGVNNRDLRTFEVSLSVSTELAREAPANTLMISESGLRSADEINKLRALGYRGFLIGEALMRADRPADFLHSLISQGSIKDHALVKVCGITNSKDALICVDAGADMLGFNFYKYSPRCITPQDARRIIEQLPPDVLSVGIFVNEASPETVTTIADQADVAVVQLHGDETPRYCRALRGRRVIKALRVGQSFIPDHVGEYETEAILLDGFSPKARGGTGERCDWAVAKQAQQYVSKLFLAGGLTAENVAEAIAVVQPYAVDVCSSVESAPGRKDERRVRRFITNAKRTKSADGS